MSNTKKVLIFLAFIFSISLQIKAQQKIVNPVISYAANPQTYKLAGRSVSGIDGYEDYVLIGISGLTVGQDIEIPGTSITNAVKRYWKHGLFSDVSIAVDSLVGDDAYLHIYLKARPRISTINYYGLKKSEREDMDQKLGIMKGGQITPNMIDRAQILAKKYFEDKGYKDATVQIRQRNDVTAKNQVILDVDVDKKEKKKVRHIIIDGNAQLPNKEIKGTFFKKGAFTKTNEAGKLSTLLKAKKFTPERWEEDKKHLIEKYYEHGFRDATILKDSIWNADDKHVNVYVKVDEGKKYYIRNITWVGNTVYSTDFLNSLLDIKKGDVYNQKFLNKRLSEDESSVGNQYWDHGYLFYNLQPTEVNIVGDSVDLEMRIYEGQQARIKRVRINGNDRIYENVVRRELRTKPGDLFSKAALMRTARDLASMGHFDPESVNPEPKPNYEDGTVDINWNLKQKSNDQIQLSLGWGQMGALLQMGLKLNNFSIANLLKKNKEHRGFLPVGDGETMSLNAQTNGKYYQSYGLQYATNWFGGKRPIQFTLGANFSKSTGLNSNYYNRSYMENYYNYMYGVGNYSYNNYENYLDPDKYIQIWGFYAGWGKRLRWPDDYFQLSLQLSYQRYILKNWRYFFVMSNGTANNLSLNITLNRSSTDNQLFPRTGSEFTASLSITPPWSKFDKKDYKHLANDRFSATYQQEQQEKYRWVEYHKWKFKARTFTALSNGNKCFVLMTRVEFGLLGSYNKYKKSPFETFYMGGDGMSGYSSNYAQETIGLRGYDNGQLTQHGEGYAYDRMTLELRYPLLLGNTTIYGLGFLEAGNAWTETSKFNPFDMKRSAGIGVRIFLPMVGMMGIDWAYGFDKVFGKKGGSQFHFILGQEF